MKDKKICEKKEKISFTNSMLYCFFYTGLIQQINNYLSIKLIVKIRKVKAQK